MPSRINATQERNRTTEEAVRFRETSCFNRFQALEEDVHFAPKCGLVKNNEALPSGRMESVLSDELAVDEDSWSYTWSFREVLLP